MKICREEQPHADRYEKELSLASLVNANPLGNAFVELLKETGMILREEVKMTVALDANLAS